MDQLIEFATNHLILVAAFIAVSALLAQNLIAGGDKSSITPAKATEMINREDAVIVDVRPMNDFSLGHVINSINIPIGSLGNQLKQLEKHKDKPVIIACRSGAQSAAGCKQLRKAGFEKVYNLKGGIMAWQNDNLPVSKKR
ncbi:MAG: rhodanese-like domain-containing protein [Gammaproteobacteria bacterium]|nr:rhodanese-like domain-containing protein [Gammaproteobacteria bacterium]